MTTDGEKAVIEAVLLHPTRFYKQNGMQTLGEAVEALAAEREHAHHDVLRTGCALCHGTGEQGKHVHAFTYDVDCPECNRQLMLSRTRPVGEQGATPARRSLSSLIPAVAERVAKRRAAESAR